MVIKLKQHKRAMASSTWMSRGLVSESEARKAKWLCIGGSAAHQGNPCTLIVVLACTASCREGSKI